MQVIQATSDDLHIAAPLFDQYRQFYGQPSDLDKAFHFLKERLERNESVIYLALAAQSGEGLGFTQLYPTFSSVSARRAWILNDLFVRSDRRKTGIATRLLEAAKQHAAASNAKGLSLSTAVDNLTAQSLYESFGFTRDDGFYHYDLLV
ncbi:acetyltransferase [Cohnella kolymensis]|uniref:Acetyltransferase n=1 Tax=Cohnella kolymensis TaxID=1590652 RepID=A0ABR5A3T4_9BACL|nr:acetyltransferase [Cohnella kolymensis]